MEEIFGSCDYSDFTMCFFIFYALQFGATFSGERKLFLQVEDFEKYLQCFSFFG